MAHVISEGDELYYKVRGQGPPLLMIAGGGGDGGCYDATAELLSDEFKVITYDRRGNSRSSGREPVNFEVSQQARDAVAVLHAAGERTAFVFGNSGGAIVSLELARRHPEVIRAVVVHEPPSVRVLPDAAKLRRVFAGTYRWAFVYGPRLAMLRFMLYTRIPWRALAKIPRELRARIKHNHAHFTRNEMIGMSSYMPDVEQVRVNGVNIHLAAGTDSLRRGRFYARTATVLADQLGCELVRFPGNHLSFLDRPAEWTATLRALLHANSDLGDANVPPRSDAATDRERS